MSLEAAFSKENYELRNMVGRGRSEGARSLSPGTRGVSRGRHHSRSSSRRRNGSRARSQYEDSNWKWCILRRDPYERFKGKNYVDDRDDEDDSDDDSDISEEEQISDDEADFNFDINDIVLPNFRFSINDFYKKRSQNLSSMTQSLNLSDESKQKISIDDELKAKEEEEEDKKRKEELEKLLAEKAEELRQHSEVLGLGKALSDSKSSGDTLPDDIDKIKEKLQGLGVEDPSKLTIDYIIDIEAKKDKVYDEYKKLLIEKSKHDSDDDIEHEKSTSQDSQNRITQSNLDIDTEQLRVSRSITLGNFFSKMGEQSKKAKDVDSYLIYLDLSADSINALQYTIGSIVNSGDVLYVINSANNENEIDYYKKQCDKLTELLTTYLDLIDSNEEFTLHVVLESAHHLYPKNLVNELIRFLKPKLFIAGFKILQFELSNYMTDIPLLVVKKKTRRKSIGGYTRA